jgi:hypothetical protein
MTRGTKRRDVGGSRRSSTRSCASERVAGRLYGRKCTRLVGRFMPQSTLRHAGGVRPSVCRLSDYYMHDARREDDVLVS